MGLAALPAALLLFFFLLCSAFFSVLRRRTGVVCGGSPPTGVLSEPPGSGRLTSLSLPLAGVTGGEANMKVPGVGGAEYMEEWGTGAPSGGGVVWENWPGLSAPNGGGLSSSIAAAVVAVDCRSSSKVLGTIRWLSCIL